MAIARTYFPLDPVTWMSWTDVLSLDARSCLLDLTIWQWQTGLPLPELVKTRMRLARCLSARRWPRIWSELESFFDAAPDGLRSRVIATLEQNQPAHSLRANAFGNFGAQSAYGSQQNASRPASGTYSTDSTVLSDQPEQNVDQDHFGEDAEAYVHPLSRSEDQEPDRYTEADPAPRTSRSKEPAGASRLLVWVRIAHTVLLDAESGNLEGQDPTTIGDEVKRRAAAAQLVAPSPDTWRQALDVATQQREKLHTRTGEKPITAALRVLRSVLEGSEGIWVPQDDINRLVWTVVQSTWRSAALEAFRADVLALAYRLTTYAHDPRFETRPTKVPHAYDVRLLKERP